MHQTLFPDPHTVIIDKHAIELTHCTKLLFPQDRITKGNIIDYYHQIASHMLPHIKNRPLTLHRFVHGIEAEGFYQKETADYFPTWIKQAKVPKKSGGFTHYVVANNAATLIYLTNQLTLTYHPWLSTINALNKPDKMIFDLDPSGDATFADVKLVARILYDYCTERNIHPLCMTTGSRGLHVIIPLKREHDFDAVRSVARTIAESCVAQNPKKMTLEAHLKNRGNKIYIDILRNAYAQTAVAPYSVRARPHAPVATPIAWAELLDGSIHKSDQFTINTVFERVTHNPWDTLMHYSLKKIF